MASKAGRQAASHRLPEFLLLLPTGNPSCRSHTSSSSSRRRLYGYVLNNRPKLMKFVNANLMYTTPHIHSSQSSPYPNSIGFAALCRKLGQSAVIRWDIKGRSGGRWAYGWRTRYCWDGEMLIRLCVMMALEDRS